jgi:hypothetical protein
VFRDPLMANGSQVDGAIAPEPRRDENDDRSQNTQTDDDPNSAHGSLHPSIDGKPVRSLSSANGNRIVKQV